MSATQRHYTIADAATRANPHPTYALMREHDPIYRATGPSGAPFWIITRYDDVATVLKDPRFIKNARKNLPPEQAQRYVSLESDPVWDVVNNLMLDQDPPDHTRLRNLVHKAFTPRRVRDLQPRIQQITRELLDAMTNKTQGDLIEDFAFPLPVTVIAEMLGVHSDKREQFRHWTQVVLFTTDWRSTQISLMEFVQYVNELIEERRKEDKGDILSALVHAEEAGDSLDHMELLSMVFLLLVAGHETTVNLIGNGTLTLLKHPQQLQHLRANPDLLPSAIEEMLRYESPVDIPTWRYTSQPVELGGVTIPAGEVVLPSLISANRDERAFAQPHHFDIQRSPNPHLAFGSGIHYCLGAPLARMEGQIALRGLLERFPELRLEADPTTLAWNQSLLIHGLKALPVCYGRSQ